MSERAAALQTEQPLTVSPRLTPATWTETPAAWVADAGRVQLVVAPPGVTVEGGTMTFPKSEYPTREDAQRALATHYPALAYADANQDGTYNLRNVELFSTGTFNGDPYTEQDLDDIVHAYQEIGHQLKPWIKFGHNEEQALPKSAGLPALGWVENLRRVGAKLYGDLTHLPQQVYAALQKKGWRTRSPEIYWNLNWHNGKQYNRAFRAVALLGAELPANPLLGDVFHAYSQPGAPSGGDVRCYEFNPMQDFRDSTASAVQEALPGARIGSLAFQYVPGGDATGEYMVQLPDGTRATVRAVLDVSGKLSIDPPVPFTEEDVDVAFQELFANKAQRRPASQESVRPTYAPQQGQVSLGGPSVPALPAPDPAAADWDAQRTPRSADDAARLAAALAGQLVPGVSIRLENLRGTVRSGVDADGTPWQTEMTYDYGELPGTVGLDNDPVDAFVGPDPAGAQYVYVVHTRRPAAPTDTN